VALLYDIDAASIHTIDVGRLANRIERC
jgi:hypothetical protein